MSSNFDKVVEFHNKFNLSYEGGPFPLSVEEQNFRITCLREELGEYEDAVSQGDLAEQLDALVDLVYFALGTAHRSGFPFDSAFELVHTANMLKEMVTENQRRGFKLEVTKPKGWLSPDLSKLVAPKLITPESALKANLTGIVAIDGPDGAGKTTLAKRIAEMFGGEYIHLTWSPSLEENMESYRRSAIEYATALSKDRIVVLERPWLSHVVYGSVYRGGFQPVDAWRKATEDAQLIGIMAQPSNLGVWAGKYAELVTTRDEMYADEDDAKMVAVYAAFNHAILGHKHPLYNIPLLDMSKYVVYDIHQVPEEAIDEWIVNTFSELL